MPDTTQIATFAAGCFWCIEPEFANAPGVTAVTSGYMGGQTENPTYEQVCTGRTGHIEVVQVAYDPAQTDYAALLTVFWRNVDPLDARGQFADKGSQYLGGIFTHGPAQENLAEQSKETMAQQFSQPIAVFIRPAETFYPAEDYHQQYYLKNRARYQQYSAHNGRHARLADVWAGKSTTVQS